MRPTTLTAPPDAPQSLAEFKKSLHANMQDMIETTLPRWYEHLQTTEDFEEVRKSVQWLVATVGAEHKEKVDPASNLPVFHFNISGGTMSVSQETPPVELVQETPATELPILYLQAAGRVALNRDVLQGDDEC